MAIIPNTIIGHVSSICVSTKVYMGRKVTGYGTKSTGIITFCFDNIDDSGDVTSLKTTYNAKLIPNLEFLGIEEQYNEDNASVSNIYVRNDEEKIYTLGSNATTQPLLALIGQTIKIKAFDKTYSCEITTDQQTFMLLVASNNFPFTVEE